MERERTPEEREKTHIEYLRCEAKKIENEIDFITTEYKPPVKGATLDPAFRSEVYTFLKAHRDLPTTLAGVDKALADAESLFDKCLAAKPPQSPVIEPLVAGAVSKLAMQLRQLKLHLNKQAKKQAEYRRKLLEQRKIEENARISGQRKQEEAERESQNRAEQAEADRKQKEADRIASLTRSEKFQFDALTAAAARCRSYLKQNLPQSVRIKYQFELSVAEKGIAELLAGRMVERGDLATEADLHRSISMYRTQSNLTKDPEKREKLQAKLNEAELKLKERFKQKREIGQNKTKEQEKSQ